MGGSVVGDAPSGAPRWRPRRPSAARGRRARSSSTSVRSRGRSRSSRRCPAASCRAARARRRTPGAGRAPSAAREQRRCRRRRRRAPPRSGCAAAAASAGAQVLGAQRRAGRRAATATGRARRSRGDARRARPRPPRRGPPPGRRRRARPARGDLGATARVGGDDERPGAGGIPAQQAVRQSVARASGERPRGRRPAGGAGATWRAAPPLTGTTRCQSGRVRGHRHDRRSAGARCSTPTPRSREDAHSTTLPHRYGDHVTARGTRALPFAYRFAVAILRPAADAPHQARLARRGEPADARRLRRLPQPPLLRRPAGLRALPRRQRPPAVLPRQGRGVFRVPVVGAILRGAEQIPVYRKTGRAADAYRAAVAAVESGKCVAIYPEGTLTRDPDLWPMVGKTGAARIALDDAVPGHPRGAVGCAGGARALRQAAAPAARARRCRCAPARPSTSTTSTTSRHRRRCCARRPTGSWRRSPAELEAHPRRAGPGRAVRPAQARAARRPASFHRRKGRPHDARAAVLRDRQLGHGVRRGARRRRHDRARCGAAARRWSTRSTPGATRTTCPSSRCPSGIRATTDPAEAADGADIVVLAVPVADAARQPRRVGRRCCRRRRRSSR